MTSPPTTPTRPTSTSSTTAPSIVVSPHKSNTNPNANPHSPTDYTTLSSFPPHSLLPSAPSTPSRTKSPAGATLDNLTTPPTRNSNGNLNGNGNPDGDSINPSGSSSSYSYPGGAPPTPTLTYLSDPLSSLSLSSSPSLLISIANSDKLQDSIKRKELQRMLWRASGSGDGNVLEVLLAKSSSNHHRNHNRNNDSNAGDPTPTKSRPNPSALSDDPSSSSDEEGSPKQSSGGACLSYLNLEAKDEDGNSALILAAAFGHGDCVRILVEAGGKVGVTDGAGWTPLHWAVQINSLPIASYLLNHRADPSVRSFKGLTPYDLAQNGPDGDDLRDVLRAADEALEQEQEQREREAEEAEARGEQVDWKGKGKRRPRDSISVRSTASAASSSREAREREEEKEKEWKKKWELAMESQRYLEIDLGNLGMASDANGLGGDLSGGLMSALDDGTATIKSHSWRGADDGWGLGMGGTMGSRNRTSTGSNPFGFGMNDEEPDWGEQLDQSSTFVWDKCLPDQMLVFSMDDLPALFDLIITDMKPLRSRSQRPVPANVLFLSARFAHYYGSVEMMDELLLGGIESIESAVHNNPDDMTNCAFWLSNSLLLLYYLRKEPNLFQSTTDYQIHLSDLINEIFVFVVRDAERRIDRVLEAAMLDYEALPGFEDVRFEGEWRMLKKLTGRDKKDNKKTSVASLFTNGGTPSTPPSPPASPRKSRPGSVPSTPSGRSSKTSHPPHSDVPDPNLVSPRTVTSLLSSTLFVLQCYEIHPSVVVQAFSQVFYWLSCEIFNRILTRKKYLCRSKAIQIRLNASTLEDWARLNRMPTKMVTAHFTPLNQLLQWLQCLSSESSIDGLIATIHNLGALNPLQLRKAVKDYRYEVDESRMSDDCTTYLLQVQKQWEKQRISRSVEHASRLNTRGGTPTPASSDAGGASLNANGASINDPSSPTPSHGSLPARDASSPAEFDNDASKMLDEAFGDPSKFGTWKPPGGVESLGELLDSRYMLPFALPSSAEMLLSFGGPDAFGPFSPWSGSRPSTPAPGSKRPFSVGYSPAPSGVEADQGLQPGVGGGADGMSEKPGIAPGFQDENGQLPTAKPEPPKFIPILPDGFLEKLDAKKAMNLGRSTASNRTVVGNRVRQPSEDDGADVTTLKLSEVKGGSVPLTEWETLDVDDDGNDLYKSASKEDQDDESDDGDDAEPTAVIG